MKLKSQRTRAGFTVHDAPRVKQLLHDRRLLIDEQKDTLPAPLPSVSLPMWRWHAFWAVMILLTALTLHVAFFYPRLPAEVATHFNARGLADGWGPKTELLGVMIFANCFIAGVFLMLAYATSQTSARILGSYLLWVGAATLGFSLTMAHLVMQANLSATQSMGHAPIWALGVWLACVVGVLGRMIWRLS